MSDEPARTTQHVSTDVYCGAEHPADRKRGERHSRIHGRYISTVRGARLERTGRILRRSEELYLREGKVYFGAVCPDKDCGMVTEYEIVAPLLPTPARPAAAPPRRRQMRGPVPAEP